MRNRFRRGFNSGTVKLILYERGEIKYFRKVEELTKLRHFAWRMFARNILPKI